MSSEKSPIPIPPWIAEERRFGIIFGACICILYVFAQRFSAESPTVESGMYSVHEHPGKRNSRQSKCPDPEVISENNPHYRSRKQARENSACNRNNDCCNFFCHHVLPPFSTVNLHKYFRLILTSLKWIVNPKSHCNVNISVSCITLSCFDRVVQFRIFEFIHVHNYQSQTSGLFTVESFENEAV